MDKLSARTSRYLAHKDLRESHPYKYETLTGPDKIRVLTITSCHRGRIEVRLDQISHTDGGYQALSYVWGNPTQAFRGLVVDHDSKQQGWIALTESLRDALYDLWKAPGITSKRFWIDQICIDQLGDEKNHQVALMGDIYVHASMVILYLGREDGDAKTAEQGALLLESVHEQFKPNSGFLEEQGSLGAIHQHRGEMPVQRLSENLDGLSEDAWEWPARLAFGSWAQRIWLVQEQLLNPNLAMLKGTRMVPWEAVVYFAVVWDLELIPPLASMLRNLSDSGGDTWIGPYDTTQSLYFIWLRRQRAATAVRTHPKAAVAATWKTEVSILPLVHNLSHYGSFSCSQARDRIYSLLAISSDSSNINPDYTASTQDVFLAVSTTLLRQMFDPSILLLACRWNNDTTSMPSWCLNVPPVSEFESSWIRSVMGVSTHPILMFTPDTTPRLLNDTKVMLLRGREVDKLDFACQPMYQNRSMENGIVDTKYAEGHLPILRSIFALFFRLGSTRIAMLTVTEMLTHDLSLNSNELPEKEMASAYNLWHYLCQIINSLRKSIHDKEYQTLSAALCDMAATFTSSVLSIDDVDRDASGRFNAMSVLRGRSLGITKSGRAFSAMNRVQEGDCVFALEGWGDRLWTLRPVADGRYRLVGDIWVHGLMSGELYDGIDPKDVDYDIEIV